jgi:hypothetical protein
MYTLKLKYYDRWCKVTKSMGNLAGKLP